MKGVEVWYTENSEFTPKINWKLKSTKIWMNSSKTVQSAKTLEIIL